MENKINITDFYYNRYIKSLIFDVEELPKLKAGKYDQKVLTENFIKYLTKFVEELKQLDYLESTEIDVIFYIINYIRYNFPYEDDIQKSKYNEMFNFMIITLNCLEGRGIEKFYLSEFAKRFSGKRMIYLYRNFAYYQQIIKDSLGVDFIYLNYAFGFFSDEDFEKSLHLLSNDIYYFMFLNSILFENDELLSSKKLIERTKKIISYTSQEDTFSSNKEEKKLIKKYKKYYGTVLDLYKS